MRLKHEVIDEESAHVFGSDVKRLDKPHVTAGANKFEGVSRGWLQQNLRGKKWVERTHFPTKRLCLDGGCGIWAW